MKKGLDVVAFAKTLVGRHYVLGAVVPKDDANYKGSFDCAEFVAFTNFQVLGILYGCDSDAVMHAHSADAYTGYFQRDAKVLGKAITIEQAAKTPGAMLLRFPAPGAVGHIIFAQGNGKSVEANCTKYGCIESVISGRHFDIGILLPGVKYDQLEDVVIVRPKVFKLETPNMVDPFIGKVQKALGLLQDDIFGKRTNDAIVSYQRKVGLVVDGQVMPGGETAKSLNI